jgi:hypothetical protein
MLILWAHRAIVPFHKLSIDLILTFGTAVVELVFVCLAISYEYFFLVAFAQFRRMLTSS